MKPAPCILLLLFFVLTAPVAGPAWAQANDPNDEDTNKEFRLAKLHLMDMSMRSDSIGIRLAQSRFEPLMGTQGVAALAHYYMAFGDWQRSNIASENDDQIKLLKACVDDLKTAAELDEHFADAYALAVVCYFPLYWLTPQDVVTVATEINTMLKKGLELAPTNPRMVLVDAMNIFYTPEQFGGNQERGMERFQEAIKLCGQQPKEDGIYPDWCPAIAYAWTSQAYLNMKPPQPEKAKAAANQALALRPDFTYAKYTLLPQAEQALQQN